MFTKERIVELHWKLNPSLFKKANKEYVNLFPERLGSSTPAITKLLNHSEELKVIMSYMPNIAAEGIPNIQEIRNYFYAIDVFVKPGGTKMQVGWQYDVNDESKEAAIKQLAMKAKKKFETSEDLGKYVEGIDSKGKPNITEENKYRYGRPINPTEYIWWRYSTYHPEVVKHMDDINKSPKLKFYLSDEESKRIRRKQTLAKSNEAMKVYLKVIESEESMNNIIDIMYTNPDYKTITKEDKPDIINRLYNESPDKFVSVAEDDKLKDRAIVERMIRYGVLKRLDGSAVIVDSADSSNLVGNNMDEAIMFLSNPAKKANADEFKHKLKALTSVK